MIVVTNTSGYQYSEDKLKRAVRAIFCILKIPVSSLLEINLVNPRRMYFLNKKFRGKRRATTVLSFKGGGFPAGEDRVFGEIYMCPKLIFGQEPPPYVFPRGEQAYLMYYLVHGILHLAGFDHEKSPSHRFRMERCEKRIFNSLFVHEPKTVLRN